jgi:hypothetical protein
MSAGHHDPNSDADPAAGERHTTARASRNVVGGSVIVRKSSRGRTYLAAAPAALTLLVTVVLLISMRGQRVSDWYERAAADALVNGDYATAQVCYERLLQDGAGDQVRNRQGLDLANAKIAQLSQAAFEKRAAGGGGTR